MCDSANAFCRSYDVEAGSGGGGGAFDLTECVPYPEACADAPSCACIGGMGCASFMGDVCTEMNGEFYSLGCIP